MYLKIYLKISLKNKFKIVIYVNKLTKIRLVMEYRGEHFNLIKVGRKVKNKVSRPSKQIQSDLVSHLNT